MGKNKKRGIIWRSFAMLGRLINGIRLLILNLLFLGLAFAVWFALETVEPQSHSVPSHAILAVSPTGVLVERQSYSDTLLSLLSEDDTNHEVVLGDIITAIDNAASDSDIIAMTMQFDRLRGMGMTHALEISQAVERFKDSGKTVYFRSNNLSQVNYLLASFADEVYLHPMGSVEVKGLAVYRNYFKTLLDRMSIDFHIFRVGTYKSALEPVMLDGMSAADRRSNSVWLTSLWQQYTTTVETNRQMPAHFIDHYIDNIAVEMEQYRGDGAEAALAAGYIDGIKNQQQYKDYLAEKTASDLDHQLISYSDYIERYNSRSAVSANKIGLIIAEGNIVDGNEPYGAIGGDSLAELIAQARQQRNVKALVLRINSGGGSAFASEVIREEVLRFKGSGKKLVVSMGPVAASGGYWIAAPADQIWASATTLTGSIGIFAALPNIQRSLKELGISSDGVATSDIAGGYRIDRALDEKSVQVIQSQIENGYNRFLQVVAEGRNMSTQAVEAIAEGRVWSGKDALDKGLVDNIGSLQDAVQSAATLANISHYEVIAIEPELSPKQQFMLELSGATALWAPQSWQSSLATMFSVLGLTELARHSELLLDDRDPRGFYAQCTRCLAL